MKKSNDNIGYLKVLLSDLEDSFDEIVLNHDEDNCSEQDEDVYNSSLRNIKLQIDKIKQQIKDVKERRRYNDNKSENARG